MGKGVLDAVASVNGEIAENLVGFDATEQESVVVELILPPQSSLIGERLIDTQIKRDTALKIIAIKRIRLHWTEKKLVSRGIRRSRRGRSTLSFLM